MKKWFVISLTMAMLSVPAVVFADESSQSNEGTVIVVDVWDAEESDIHEEEPFIPGDIDKAALAPEDVNKSIIGTDDRVMVNDPYSYPFSAIALMNVTAKCGDSWSSTAFMVGPDRLITASHCLVCNEHSSWAECIDFYFGFNNYSDYRYHYGGKWTAYAGNIYDDHEYSIVNDFGVIKLYDNVGDIVGWFGTYWGMSDSSIESELLYEAGYRDGRIGYDLGFVKVLDNDHVYYTLDTVPGYSGGPIFTADNYAVGVNIAERDIDNIGFRLSNKVKNYLDSLE